MAVVGELSFYELPGTITLIVDRKEIRRIEPRVLDACPATERVALAQTLLKPVDTIKGNYIEALSFEVLNRRKLPFSVAKRRTKKD